MEQFSDGDSYHPDDARPSADGKRFGRALNKCHGGSAFLDIPSHGFVKQLLVCDLASRRWIFRLDGKKQKIRTLSGLALSPDCLLMGLITRDGVLEVYRLPKAEDPSDSSR